MTWKMYFLFHTPTVCSFFLYSFPLLSLSFSFSLSALWVVVAQDTWMTFTSHWLT